MAHLPVRQAPLPHRIQVLVANLFCVTALTLIPTLAHANPEGGQVVAGSATIAQPNPANVAVTQTSQKAVINWNSFSIRAGEQTTFAQPNAQAIALNRVVGVDPSTIMGTLKANGQVWLVNPNGIVFGKTAIVDVGGLLATTLDISNRDFMAGNYKFSGNRHGGAMVVNAGHITVKDTGLAALVAPGVENSGVIMARLGMIQLASTNGFTVDLNGDGTFNFLLDQQVTQQLVRPDGTTPSAAITNSGSLIAEGGTILLTANAAKSVVDNAIDMTGYALARGVSMQGGTVILDGGDSGAVRVSGTLDALGQGGQNGGTIKVLGGMTDGTVNVSGTLDASAPNGGNGGFIETSAAHVEVADSARVTTSAPFGKTGTWLIDPNDFTIAPSGGDMTGTALSNYLTSSDMNVISSAGNVNVNDAVHWSANTLTMTAGNNINVKAVMTASDNASLAMNGAAGDPVVMGMSGGNFIGRVDFSGTGTLSINGTPYTVINSLGVPGDTGTTTLQGMQNNLTGHYVLGSNIDASATNTWNSGAGFMPIGESTAFSGVFDGLGHTIGNLYINTGSLNYAGLFGRFNAGTRVQNVGINGGSVTDTANLSSAGGLVGYNSGGTISNSYTTSNVSGGIAGTGGLIGWSDSNGTVSSSYATGNVSGITSVGGLIGVAISGTISNSYATGNVSFGGFGGTGGLIGLANATINNSYATGNVSGGSVGGGLVGSNDTGTISNSYATGAVTIIGNGNSVGGLVGSNTGTISNSYWNTQASGQLIGIGGTTNLSGATGLTTAQMKTMANFTGWDIANTGGAGKIWRVYDGSTYPLLTSFLTPLTVTANAASKTYDGTAFSGGNGVTYSVASPVVSGTLVYGGNSQGAVNAGSYTITPSGLYSNQQGYDISYANGALTIGSASLTLASVTANNASKTYGTTLTFNGTEFTPVGLVGSDHIGSVSLTSTGAPATANVGTYAIVPSAAIFSVGSASNYTISYVNGVLTVNKAPLTATANAASKTYNGLAYSGGNGVAYSGFVNSESASVLGGTLAYSGTSQGAVNAGSYVITPSGLTSGNYNITYVSGALTVSTAPLTLASVTANNASKTYGTTLTFNGTEFTPVGLAGSDHISSVALTSTGAPATANAGTYAIVPSAAVFSVGSASNYTISYVNGVLTVTKAPLTWSVADAASTFGTTPTLGATHLSGIVGSDSVNGTAGAFSGSSSITLSTSTPTGTYSEKVTGLSGSAVSNYTLASTGNLPGTLTVSAAAPPPAPTPTPSVSPQQQAATTQVLSQNANLSTTAISTVKTSEQAQMLADIQHAMGYQTQIVNPTLFKEIVSTLQLNNQYSTDTGGWIYPNHYSDPTNDHECVALVLALLPALKSPIPGYSAMHFWTPGLNVIDSAGQPNPALQPGTAIATFDSNGHYPVGGMMPPGSPGAGTAAHTAIFLGYDTLNGVPGFYMLDQNAAQKAEIRFHVFNAAAKEYRAIVPSSNP